MIKHKDITPNFWFLVNFTIRHLLELDKHHKMNSDMKVIRWILLDNINTMNNIIDGKENVR